MSHFSDFGEKCEKTLDQLVQGDPRKTLRSPGLAENLHGRHLDRETQGSAPKTPLNSVHGEKPCRSPTLPGRTGLSTICSAVRKTVSWGKTRRTSTSSNTTQSWNVNVLLHSSPLVLLNRVIQHNHGKGDFRRHFRQLFHQLRSTQNRAQRDVLGVDLGHFNNRLGNGREPVEELEHVLQLFHRLRHRIVEKRHHRDCVDDLFHGAPLYL